MSGEIREMPREVEAGAAAAASGPYGLADVVSVRAGAAAVHVAGAGGPATSMRRDALLRRMLLMADLAAIVGAFGLMIGLSSTSPRLMWPRLMWPLLVGVPILLVGAKLAGLYDRDEALLHKTTLEETPRLFHMATLCALVAWLSSGLFVSGTLTRADAFVLWLALIVLLMLARTSARALALRAAPVERCLLIGDESSAKVVRSKLIGHHGVKAELVAHLDCDEIAPWSTEDCSEYRLAEIRDLAQALDVHRVILVPQSADAGEMLDLVRTLKAVGVRVSVLPRLLEVVGSSVEFDDLHGVMVMGIRRFDLTRSSAAVKRAFDLLGATLMLAAAGPLMLLIAIAIKLDSKGPVLFRQLRVGWRGERFNMLKFRTMVDGADTMKDSLRHRNEVQGGMFKIVDDPRVTRVGKLLRQTALDELPQLFNVLKGEMSLVGPRPLVIEEDDRIEGWHRQRLELMPGMTGHWQILGPARVPLHEMVAIDYLYVANWSLWTDIKILLRTIPHVIGRRGL